MTKCPTCRSPIEEGVFFAPHVMIFDGQVVKLSPKQIEIARFLHERSPKVQSVRQIMYGIYKSEDEFPTNKCIEVQIFRMRTLLEDALGCVGKHIIGTDYGKGYMWR